MCHLKVGFLFNIFLLAFGKVRQPLNYSAGTSGVGSTGASTGVSGVASGATGVSSVIFVLF